MKRDPGAIRVIPLGGVGEIGKNMTALEIGDEIFVIDCGMTFPRLEQPGVDLVLPDFAYLAERRDRITAIILTHGHEDHIGALPFFLREVGQIPVYASRFTLALVRAKLDEHRLSAGAKLHEVASGQRSKIGKIEIQFHRVTHSIPDCLALALYTPVGTIVHTGDFRFDHSPIDGLATDIEGLSQLGDQGVVLLLSDSTNAEVPGTIASERSLGPPLRRLLATAPGRVVVTTFSSQIHRIQQVLDATANDGRVAAIVGRSMVRNTGIATTLDILKIREGTIVTPKAIESYPADEQVVVCTGSQGEPSSALRRMAHGDHPQISIRQGDTVVFSARTVPGNELARNDTVNRLVRAGATVVLESADVHASGHGAADELRLMLRLIRPKFFAPVHGEARHQKAHADIARSVGINSDAITILDNGDVLEVTGDRAGVIGRVEVGISLVEGLRVGDVSEGILRDRRRLSADGLVTLVVTIDSREGEPVGEPQVVTRGFAHDDEELILEIKQAVSVTIANAAADHDPEFDLLRQRLHDDIAAIVHRRTRQRPMVLPVVIPV